MKILVTGGAGFIGSHIVEELLSENHEIVVLDNFNSGKKENIPTGVKLVEGTVTEPLFDLFMKEQFEVVIHHAAQVSVPRSVQDPILDLDVNLTGLLQVLEAARKTGVRKVIFASSAAVYGAPQQVPITEVHPLIPLSPYGLTKKASEEYLRIYADLHGLKYTVFRYGNVYGPRQPFKGESGVVSIFTDLLCRGEKATIFGDGSDTRDYIYVKDVAKANLLALHSGDNEIYNVSTQVAVTLNELYSLFQELIEDRKEPLFGPERPGDIKHSLLNNHKLMSLGWKPEVSLRDGLLETITWKKGTISRS